MLDFLAGAVMGLLVLAFFNVFQRVLEHWISYKHWYEPKLKDENMKVRHKYSKKLHFRRMFSFPGSVDW